MTANKILRGAILTGIFLLPFAALVVWNQLFFPFITGKNFTFRVIVEIITALWLIFALRDASALPKLSKIFWAFLIFISVIFISDLLSPNVYKSFWSNYERMEGWVTLAHLFALFVVASSVMTRRLWEWLFRVSVCVSLILFFYGLFQLSGKLAIHQGGVRLDATLGNATYLAVYMLFHIFLNLILWFKALKGSLWRWFYAFALLAELFILYHTATRGATLGLIGGLFLSALLIALFDKENQSGVRKIAALGIAAIVVLVGAFWLLKGSPIIAKNPVLGRFAELSLTDKTAEARFRIWSMAIEGFKERPILGWGQESFNYVFNKYYDPRHYSNEQWFDRTHNVFFDWLIAGGILGALAYLSLFGLPLYYLWKRESQFSLIEKSLITGLFAGYFFHNLTVFDNITSYILFVFLISYIQSQTPRPPTRLAERVGAMDPGVKNRVLIPIIGAAAVFTLYAVNVPPLLASSNLIQALRSQTGGPAVNLKYYEKALSYGTFGDSEIREQLFQAVSQSASVAGVDPKIKEDFFNLAEKQTRLQLLRTPEDARYFLFAGVLMSSFGQFDRAIEYLEKARELSPKKQTILFALGSAHLSRRDYGNGIRVLKDALELEPSFEEARKLYALALIYGKQAEEAEKVLTPLSNREEVVMNERFILAYYTAGYFEKALVIADALVKRDPKNPQYYFTRAVMEVALFRSAAAIADLNKVAELNPASKAQIDELIKKVRAGQRII